jgi:hypothetical protein
LKRDRTRADLLAEDDDRAHSYKFGLHAAVHWHESSWLQLSLASAGLLVTGQEQVAAVARSGCLRRNGDRLGKKAIRTERTTLFFANEVYFGTPGSNAHQKTSAKAMRNSGIAQNQELRNSVHGTATRSKSTTTAE